MGVDLGTSGVRACAIDQQGKLLAEAATGLASPVSPAAGHLEQDPNLWWCACLGVLDELLLGSVLNPLAISVDGTSGTLLLCDGDGSPLGPALMYNDSRASTEARRLGQIAPADAAVHSPSSALAKLCHLSQKTEPKAEYALHQADWILGRLGDTYGLSDENNALKMGYDPVQRRWPAWLRDCPIDRALLPRVCPVGQTLATLSEALTRRWKLVLPPRIVAGTTDSNAAALACGLRQTGEAATSLGSTLVIKVLSERPVFHAAYGIYSHRVGRHWLVGGASNSGGRGLLEYFSPRQLAELSQAMLPDIESGLDYYPLIGKGERFPINDPQLPPRLLPRPKDDVLFLRGLLEGIARIEQQGYRKLQELGAPYPSRVLTSGGGSHNAVWREIRERLLGVPVSTAEHTEAAYGSALIAAGKIP